MVLLTRAPLQIGQGHLAEVESALEVKRVMHELMQNGKIARATHNMVAYRIETEAGTMLQDCDDDGEHGASSRMLHLLQVGAVSGSVLLRRTSHHFLTRTSAHVFSSARSWRRPMSWW